MKKLTLKLCMFLLCIGCSLTVFAQEKEKKENIPNSDSTIIKEVQKGFKEIKEAFDNNITKDSITKFEILDQVEALKEQNTIAQTEDSIAMDSMNKEITQLQQTLTAMQSIMAKDTQEMVVVGVFKLKTKAESDEQGGAEDEKGNRRQQPKYSTSAIKINSCTDSCDNDETYLKCCTNCDSKGKKLKKCKKKCKKKCIERCKKESVDSVDIEIAKILLSGRDGLIRDIQVITTDDKIFTNQKAPIGINNISDRYNDKLFYRDEYIELGDLLIYERRGLSVGSDFFIELTPDSPTAKLYRNVGINSVFDIRICSDVLGLTGVQDNGLVQTEIGFRAPMRLTNGRNKPMFWFHYLDLNAQLSKFDSDFRFTNLTFTPADTIIQEADTIYSSNDTSFIPADTTITPADTAFSRSTFYQRSYVSMEIGINILSGYFSNKSNNEYFIDLTGRYSSSRVRTNQDSFHIGILQLGLKPGFNLRPGPNLGVRFAIPISAQFAPNLRKYGYDRLKWVFEPEVLIYWHPIKSSNSKLFAKARVVIIAGEQEPFGQLQVGYNIVLSDLINNAAKK